MASQPLNAFVAIPYLSKFERQSEGMVDVLNDLNEQGQFDKIYEHQISAVFKTRAMYLLDEAAFQQQQLLPNPNLSNQPMVIVAPTGAGKTGVITFLPYVLRSKRVLILTPSKVITSQISDAFIHTPENPCFFVKIGFPNTQDFLDNTLEDVRVIQSKNDANAQSRLVVVNAQKFGGLSGLSLMHDDVEIVENARDFFRRFDTLIVDEAHHYRAETWRKVVKEFMRPAPEFRRKKIVFLTATPYQPLPNNQRQFILGKGLEQRISYQITRTQLEELGIIRRLEFREVQLANLYQHLKEIFNQHEVHEPRFTAQAMVLVRTIQEANQLAQFLNGYENGFAVAAHTQNPDWLNEFKQENCRVAITCGVALEGYDNPNVIACVINRKIVTGRILFQQFIGRCMRMKRGLEGELPDRSKGIVMSFPELPNIQELFNNRDELAQTDPIEVDVVEK